MGYCGVFKLICLECARIILGFILISKRQPKVPSPCFLRKVCLIFTFFFGCTGSVGVFEFLKLKMIGFGGLTKSTIFREK